MLLILAVYEKVRRHSATWRHRRRMTHTHTHNRAHCRGATSARSVSVCGPRAYVAACDHDNVLYSISERDRQSESVCAKRKSGKGDPGRKNEWPPIPIFRSEEKKTPDWVLNNLKGHSTQACNPTFQHWAKINKCYSWLQVNDWFKAFVTDVVVLFFKLFIVSSGFSYMKEFCLQSWRSEKEGCVLVCLVWFHQNRKTWAVSTAAGFWAHSPSMWYNTWGSKSPAWLLIYWNLRNAPAETSDQIKHQIVH